MVVGCCGFGFDGVMAAHRRCPGPFRQPRLPRAVPWPRRLGKTGEMTAKTGNRPARFLDWTSALRETPVHTDMRGAFADTSPAWRRDGQEPARQSCCRTG